MKLGLVPTLKHHYAQTFVRARFSGFTLVVHEKLKDSKTIEELENQRFVP